MDFSNTEGNDVLLEHSSTLRIIMIIIIINFKFIFQSVTVLASNMSGIELPRCILSRIAQDWSPFIKPPKNCSFPVP